MAAPNIVQTDIGIATLIGAGVGQFIVPLEIELVDQLTGVNLMTNFVPGFKGRLIGISFLVTVAATTAAKLLTITPSLVHAGVTTAVTGGVVSLTSANCTPEGVTVAGTAITALNAFGAADGITLALTTSAAFTEGKGIVMLTMVNDNTLDAMAKAMVMFNQAIT